MRAAQAQLQQPNRLGPYQLLAKIGEGGTSAVHLAKMDGPAGFNKLAVIKELRAELTGSSEFRALFLNEMRLAARLAHPNVIHAYGASEDRGRLYLAMEYLDGQPWSRGRRVLQQRGMLPPELHFKVLAEVLAGLHYAHELRDYDGSPLHVVHCDVSPQNVFVTHDGLVKVVDFGVARAVFRGSSAPDLIGGKLSYIAPEQLRGDPIDRRADLFAVGVLLWEAVTGQCYAQTKDPNEARRRRESGTEPRMAAVAPTAPAALVEICDRALALEPSDRFATAAEFREALLNFLGEDMQDADRVQLGKQLGAAFHKERTHIHGILERHLKSPSNVTSSMERWTSRPAGATTELVHRTGEGRSSSNAARHEHSPSTAPLASPQARTIQYGLRERARRTLRQPQLVLPLLGAVVGLLSFSITLNASGPEVERPGIEPGAVRIDAPARQKAASSTITSSSTATDPAAAPRLMPAAIRLSIAAHPDSATLYLDGVPLPENPYTARLLADHQVHTLRAATIGDSSQTQFIIFDRDRAVSFELDPRPMDRARKAVESAPVSEAGKAQRRLNVLSAKPGNTAPAPREPSDGYDQPLRRQNISRPIYEQDPYR